MSLILKSNDSFSDVENLIPYIEKDQSIIRGVTLGLIDFSNNYSKPIGIPDGASIPVTTQLSSLTSGGLGGAVTGSPFNLGITGGGVNGSTTGANSAAITLPDTNFRVPTAVSGNRVLIVGWAKIKASGYLTGQSNLAILIWGDCSNTGNNIGHFMVQIDTAGNATTGSRFQLYGLQTNTSIGASLLSKFDGQIHQFALEGVYVGTTMTLNVYVDKVLVGTINGSLPSPHAGSANSQRLFSTNVFNNTTGIHTGNKIYRYAVHNLTTRSDLTTEYMLQADWDATVGYIS